MDAEEVMLKPDVRGDHAVLCHKCVCDGDQGLRGLSGYQQMVDIDEDGITRPVGNFGERTKVVKVSLEAEANDGGGELFVQENCGLSTSVKRLPELFDDFPVMS